MPKTRNVDPTVGIVRARLGSAERYRPGDDHSDIRRDLNEAKAAAYIKRLLEAAPPLTEEQRTRLAELLKPVRVNGGGSDAA